MKRLKHSFSSRLSIRTIALASVLFLVTMALVAFGGGRIVKEGSINYARQKLLLAIGDLETVFTNTEDLSTFCAAFASEQPIGTSAADTGKFFRFLDCVVRDDPSVFGAGFFFEPYVFDKSTRIAGIYVNRDEDGENLIHEWDDDKSFAKDGWDYFALDWYADSKETLFHGWSPTSIEDMGTYYMYVMAYQEIIRNEKGDFIGVSSVDISIDWFGEKLMEVRPYPHSNVVLLDSTFSLLCNPIVEGYGYVGKSAYDTPFLVGSDVTISQYMSEGQFREKALNEEIVRVGHGRDANYLVFDKMDNGWIICVSLVVSDIYADLHSLWKILVVLTIASLIVLFFSNRKMVKRLSSPIRDFAEVARKITDGQFNVPVPDIRTGDELTELGNALVYMQESLRKYIAELQVTTAEKARLGSELSVARDIQSQMLCRAFPDLKTGGIFADSIPAKEVGGDLYDFFIDGDTLHFILGDVSGKGVPAALLMSITIAAFRAVDKNNASVEQIVSMINDTFCKSSDDLMFVTLVVGKLDLKTGKLEFCNAGHNPILIVGPEGDASYMKPKTNVACGVLPGFRYEGEEIALSAGSRLIVYSDGITEAENSGKEQYGEERLDEWAGSSASGRKNEKEVVESLLQSVHGFIAGAEQNDDMTIMSISI